MLVDMKTPVADMPDLSGARAHWRAGLGNPARRFHEHPSRP